MASWPPLSQTFSLPINKSGICSVRLLKIPFITGISTNINTNANIGAPLTLYCIHYYLGLIYMMSCLFTALNFFSATRYAIFRCTPVRTFTA